MLSVAWSLHLCYLEHAANSHCNGYAVSKSVQRVNSLGPGETFVPRSSVEDIFKSSGLSAGEAEATHKPSSRVG